MRSPLISVLFMSMMLASTNGAVRPTKPHVWPAKLPYIITSKKDLRSPADYVSEVQKAHGAIGVLAPGLGQTRAVNL